MEQVKFQERAEAHNGSLDHIGNVSPCYISQILAKVWGLSLKLWCTTNQGIKVFCCELLLSL